MMHRRLLSAVSLLTLGAALTGCGADQATPPLVDGSSKGVATSAGGDSSQTGGGTSNSPTSNGPVVTVRVSPQTITIAQNRWAAVSAIGVDAQGVRVANTKAVWTSSNESVAAVSDTGLVYGKAVGTAKVYGTINGHTDSATVTVIEGSGTTNPPPPTPVASFDLTAHIRGSLGGVDTSKVEDVAGATVKLVRRGGTTGDSLAVPIEIGSAVSDIKGFVSFKGLTGGTYSVEITPANGSPYAVMFTGFSPPLVQDFRPSFVLRRR